MKPTRTRTLLLLLSALILASAATAWGQTPLVNSLPTICNSGQKVNLNPASGTVVASAMLPGVYTCDATQTLSPTFPWVWNVPAGAAGGAVSSVFGRTGAVTAQTGDYTATNVGLGNVTNNTQTKASVVPNTLPTAGQILVGNAGGTAYAPVSMSGDCGLASTGAITCSAVTPTLNAVTDPTADKTFTMGAHKLLFNLTADYGAGYGVAVVSNGSNAATGPLFELSTGSSTTMDVLDACGQGASNCVVVTKDGLLTTIGSGAIDGAKITGATPVRVPVLTVATLPTCNSGAEGTERGVTDADTAAWGDTVVHTSGALHVLAYCDGTLWTVAAK